MAGSTCLSTMLDAALSLSTKFTDTEAEWRFLLHMFPCSTARLRGVAQHTSLWVVPVDFSPIHHVLEASCILIFA